MVCNLREFKEYIDNEMIVILGQMDRPTEIFEHVYLVRVMSPIHLKYTFRIRCTISHFWIAHNYRVLNGMHLIWKSCKTPGEFC